MESSSKNYYQGIADYSGIVSDAKLETIGLSGEYYQWFYLNECKYYFHAKVAHKLDSRLSIISSRREGGFSLLLRRQSRLYTIKKLRKTEHNLDLTIKRQDELLRFMHTKKQDASSDKILSLSVELQEIATKVYAEAEILRSIRLGRADHAFFKSDPKNTQEHNERNTGKRIALINHFDYLLSYFDKYVVYDNPSYNKRESSNSSYQYSDPNLSANTISIPQKDRLSLDNSQVNAATVGSLYKVLLKCTVQDLTRLLTELGLLVAGRSSPSASPGAWTGVIHGLLHVQQPWLRGSKAAIQRAFAEEFGANVSERSVQVGLGTNGSEAEQFYHRTLALLDKRASAE